MAAPAEARMEAMAETLLASQGSSEPAEAHMEAMADALVASQGSTQDMPGALPKSRMPEKEEGLPATLPEETLPEEAASPAPSSHDYADVIIHKHVWTRNGNLVEPFEATLLDLELAKAEDGGGKEFPENMTGDNDGLICVPTSVASHGKIPEGIKAAGIMIRLPPDDMHRAGARLNWAENMIQMCISGQPTVYKIGITTIPVWRLSQHMKENMYDLMHLIDYSTLPGWAPMLEAALIRDHIGKTGCQNVQTGGEGPGSETGLSDKPGVAGGFVYIVTGDAGAGEMLGFQEEAPRLGVSGNPEASNPGASNQITPLERCQAPLLCR